MSPYMNYAYIRECFGIIEYKKSYSKIYIKLQQGFHSYPSKYRHIIVVIEESNYFKMFKVGGGLP